MLDKVITGYARPGLTFYQGVSRAFGMPLETVLRRAGLLPMPANATLDDRRSMQDLIRKLERLSPEDRRYAAELFDRVFPNAQE